MNQMFTRLCLIKRKFVDMCYDVFPLNRSLSKNLTAFAFAILPLFDVKEIKV
jgi:hypothetical protein